MEGCSVLEGTSLRGSRAVGVATGLKNTAGDKFLFIPDLAVGTIQNIELLCRRNVALRCSRRPIYGLFTVYLRFIY